MYYKQVGGTVIALLLMVGLGGCGNPYLGALAIMDSPSDRKTEIPSSGGQAELPKAQAPAFAEQSPNPASPPAVNSAAPPQAETFTGSITIWIPVAKSKFWVSSLAEFSSANRIRTHTSGVTIQSPQRYLEILQAKSKAGVGPDVFAVQPKELEYLCSKGAVDSFYGQWAVAKTSAQKEVARRLAEFLSKHTPN